MKQTPPKHIEIHIEPQSGSQVFNVKYKLQQLSFEEYISILTHLESIEKLGEDETEKQLHEIVSIICILSTIPKKIVKGLLVVEIITFWNALASELSNIEEIEKFDSIMIDGLEYFLDKDMANILGEPEHLPNTTLGEFCEANNYETILRNLNNDSHAYALPYIAAILLKHKGEALPEDERKRETYITQKAERFKKQLNMSQLMSIGFFLHVGKSRFLKIMGHCSPNPKPQNKEKKSLTSLSGTAGFIKQSSLDFSTDKE